MERRTPATRAPAGLSADELAVVVRRASELDTALPAESAELDLDEARAVLKEAGVSGAAAQQALDEWRRGDLAPVPAAPLDTQQGRLSPQVTVERTLPMAPSAVPDAIDRLLRRQCFARGRRYPTGGEWVPRSGLLADLRRALDIRGTLLLHEVSRLRLQVQPGLDGMSRVQLSADLGSYRSRLVGGLVVAPAAAGVVTTLIGVPLGADEMLAALPVGFALAGGGYLGASRILDKRRTNTEESLHILLDRLDSPAHLRR